MEKEQDVCSEPANLRFIVQKGWVCISITLDRVYVGVCVCVQLARLCRASDRVQVL